jgi:predicted membrane protein
MDDNAGSKIKIGVTARGNGNHASAMALVLIVAGVVLFLDNLGVLGFINIRAYWPMAIAVFGAMQLSRARNACAQVWPWTMIALGILLTLGNLNIIRADWGTTWPIFLIAAGASMLLKRTEWNWPSSFSYLSGPQRTGKGPVRNLDANAVFGSVNRRIDSPNFERADLNVIFGELKVDLRGATIAPPNKEAVIETNAAFGAIKLRVPETWRVVVHGTAIFGAYEDKTLPPRPSPGIDPPTLIISGNAAFGAVEIEN